MRPGAKWKAGPEAGQFEASLHGNAEHGEIIAELYRDDTLYVDSRMLLENPVQTLQRCCNYLGIPDRSKEGAAFIDENLRTVRTSDVNVPAGVNSEVIDKAIATYEKLKSRSGSMPDHYREPSNQIVGDSTLAGSLPVAKDFTRWRFSRLAARTRRLGRRIRNPGVGMGRLGRRMKARAGLR